MNKFALLFAATLILLSGCDLNSNNIENGNEVNTPTEISMVYDKFTGSRQTHIEVAENQPVTVIVEIVTDKGSLEATIVRDADNDVRYEGHQIPTSSFTVELSDPGRYTLNIKTVNHAGSFSFKWGK
jgi:hypothetical protein